MNIARPKPQETKITTIGKIGPVFVPAYAAIVGGLTMIKPDETPADFQPRTIAVVQSTCLKARSEDAEWAELEKELLSNAELLEIHEYLKSVGQ
jgi:hypothetical protein